MGSFQQVVLLAGAAVRGCSRPLARLVALLQKREASRVGYVRSARQFQFAALLVHGGALHLPRRARNTSFRDAVRPGRMVWAFRMPGLFLKETRP